MAHPEEQSTADVNAKLRKIVQERERYRIKNTRKYYLEEVIPAKDNGKTVIYAPGFGAGEMVYSFEDCILVVPSDNYCVYTAAKRKHRKFLDLAESRGLNPDLCSYDRLASGLMFAQDGEYGPLPPPDLIIGASNMCDTHARMWDIFTDYYKDVPFFPFYYPIPEFDERMPDHVIEFGKSQVKKALDFISEHTGKKLDRDRFKETVKLSIDTQTLYVEGVVNPRVATPSPWSTIQAMADAFYLAAYLGRQEAKDYYELVAKEVAFRVEHKIGINPKERFRLLYTELPPWFWTGIMRVFHERGATLSIEAYPSTFWLSVLFDKYNNIEPIYDLNPDEPEEAIFLRLANSSMVRSQKHMLDQYVLATEKYNLDGAVFFTNRSCQICTRSMPMRESIYRERTGKPTMSFAGEHCDDRTFSESQTMAKIDAFFDTLERQK